MNRFSIPLNWEKTKQDTAELIPVEGWVWCLMVGIAHKDDSGCPNDHVKLWVKPWTEKQAMDPTKETDLKNIIYLLVDLLEESVGKRQYDFDSRRQSATEQAQEYLREE